MSNAVSLPTHDQGKTATHTSTIAEHGIMKGILRNPTARRLLGPCALGAFMGQGASIERPLVEGPHCPAR